MGEAERVPLSLNSLQEPPDEWVIMATPSDLAALRPPPPSKEPREEKTRVPDIAISHLASGICNLLVWLHTLPLFVT
jgi:hypothetical protein